MSDLAEFLLARISDTELECDLFGTGPEPSGRVAGLLRRQCGAMRRIIADITAETHTVLEEDCWYTCAAATEERDGGETCDSTRRGGRCDCGRDRRVDRRLGILAYVFADHPDFRPEWRP